MFTDQTNLLQMFVHVSLTFPFKVHALGRCNDVPLHLAACYGHHALCALLLARWADPKLCDWSSATALQIAVQHQQLRTAEVLSEWRPLEVLEPVQGGGAERSGRFGHVAGMWQLS